MFFNKIKSDFIVNKKSGYLAIFFINNYRIGHELLILKNKGHVILWPFYLLSLLIAKMLSMIYGCSIPFSCTIGERVCFRHGMYGIFISGLAKISDDCTILHQVTIGSNYGSNKPQSAPVICNGVFIGPGAKIVGDITIGKNSKIGANALVIDDVPDNSICIAPKALIIKKFIT